MFCISCSVLGSSPDQAARAIAKGRKHVRQSHREKRLSEVDGSRDRRIRADHSHHGSGGACKDKHQCCYSAALSTLEPSAPPGDGKTLDTAAINKAIDAAAAAGGGIVRFPAGNYLCYSIHLKSHITLYLDPGATISQRTRLRKARAAAMIRPSPIPGTSFRTLATATGTTA